jgi:hypothetical protein
LGGLTPASPPTNPYTPPRPPTTTNTLPPVDTTYTDHVDDVDVDYYTDHVDNVAMALPPENGGPITSPRAQAERTRGVNRFDMEVLAHSLYHGSADGTRVLTFGFLENCGYKMLSSSDVVGSLNKIIALHGQIRTTWFNALVNTYGPQIDRILLKSFKLFPTLDSMVTMDVVDFYDRLQELSNPSSR